MRNVCARMRSDAFADVLLMRLVTHLAGGYEQLVQQALGRQRLNAVMFKTLVMAFGSPDNRINPSRLSAMTGESRANMTRICDELRERGLIRRGPGDGADRRRVVVSLTAAGERLLRKLLPQLQRSLHRAHALLSARDKRSLERLLKRQIAGLEAPPDTPAGKR